MKITTYISYCVLAIAMLMVGCSKQDIVIPDDNAPVFEAHGTLGNDTFDLVAGDNNAFMYTSTKVYNGVRIFSGELSDGETSLELGIYDGNLDMPNSVPEVDLQNVALKFARRFYDPLAVLTMESIVPNQNANHVDWYINGTFAGSGQVSIYEPGKYNICAYVTFNSGETKELCDEIILGYERNANYGIDLNLGQGDLSANLVTTGEPIQTVEWFLNGNLISDSLSLQYPIQLGVANNLKARVTFDNGTVREKSCFVDGLNPTQWISDFSIFEFSSTTSITPQDYHLRLVIEKDGKTYRSVYAENQGSSVTLVSLEPYEDNANGNTVYKATLQIEAIVMEMSTEKLIPLSFTTTLGIEVP